MKKNLTIATILLLLLVAFSGCKKEIEEVTFEVGYATTFTIPNTISVNMPLSITLPEMDSRSDEEFASEGTNADLVKSVRLKSLTLRTLSPTGETFTYLNSIQVYMDADALVEILLASLSNLDNTVDGYLELESADNVLDAYLKKDISFFRINVIPDETISQDVEIEMDVIFEVVADKMSS